MTETILDSFNRADSFALGSTDGGTVPAQPWTYPGGSIFGVAANRAAAFTGGLHNITTLGASADIDASVTLAVIGAGVGGVVIRATDPNNFIFLCNQGGSGSPVVLGKVVAGVQNNIGAAFAQTLAAGDRVRLVASADTLSVYKNGVLIGNRADTFNQYATGTGMLISDLSTRLDDFALLFLPINNTPVMRADLRAALRDRAQLDLNDPLATDTILNRYIDAAICRFSLSNPHGWPWDFAEAAALTVTGAEEMSLALDGNGFVRVDYVLLKDPAGMWQYPLERVSRAEQLERFPNDGELRTPRTFTVMGSTRGPQSIGLRMRPVPDGAYPLTIGGWKPLVSLAADSDPNIAVNDHQIGDWNDVALDYAEWLVRRAHGDAIEGIMAKQSFDAQVMTMRRSARRTRGPGIGQRPVADDPALP